MGILSDKAVLTESRAVFETLYSDYNKREYVSPDPLQFLYGYPDIRDREIVALIASSLAYGKVAQILKSIGKVLAVLGDHPAEYLKNAERAELDVKLDGFVHRFTDSQAITSFLFCVSCLLKRGGTLESLFASHVKSDNIWAAMEGFVSELMSLDGKSEMFLLPKPSNGSACKRLALFLRWMVRCDDVDPGGWTCVSPEQLVIPLDTHMFHICTSLGLSERKAAHGKTAQEITDNFKRISPCDPVKYDFSITRFGIRSEMTYEELFSRWNCERIKKK